jgi:hypothetical protein
MSWGERGVFTGNVITSNAAQGKTVDWAIPSLPVHSLLLATRELAAGATVLVVGSAIFSDGDGVVAAMNRLRAATKQAVN